MPLMSFNQKRNASALKQHLANQSKSANGSRVLPADQLEASDAAAASSLDEELDEGAASLEELNGAESKGADPVTGQSKGAEPVAAQRAESHSSSLLRDEFIINMSKFATSIKRTIQQIEGEVRLEVRFD